MVDFTLKIPYTPTNTNNQRPWTCYMQYELYPHRYADIILNADYSLKQELEDTIKSLTQTAIDSRYDLENTQKKASGKKESKGKQSTINTLFREKLTTLGWEPEKNVFNDPTNDLAIDFWKRQIGVDIAFNHRSYIGGDLLRLQAAAEVKDIIKVGVYICPTKQYAKIVSPQDASNMVNFERAQWYLENFYPVLTAPILLIGLNG